MTTTGLPMSGEGRAFTQYMGGEVVVIIASHERRIIGRITDTTPTELVLHDVAYTTRDSSIRFWVSGS